MSLLITWSRNGCGLSVTAINTQMPRRFVHICEGKGKGIYDSHKHTTWGEVIALQYVNIGD